MALTGNKVYTPFSSTLWHLNVIILLFLNPNKELSFYRLPKCPRPSIEPIAKPLLSGNNFKHDIYEFNGLSI